MKQIGLAIAAACLAATGGCSPSSDAPITALSITDHAGNAAKIASLVERLCFDHADSVGKFEDGLKSIGWTSTRTQIARAGNRLELDAWQLPHVKILLGSPAADVATCSLIVAPSASPIKDQIVGVLSDVMGHTPGADGEWWGSRLGRRLHMTADRISAAHPLFIMVEVYRVPWWQTLGSN